MLSKNQEFLIDVFEEVYKRNPNVALLMIGDGENRKKIEDRVKNLGGILTGNRDDVWRLYQGMDVFMFPSRYEGLGIAAIEAQVTGIPCILSDKITRDAKITRSVEFMSIENNKHAWQKEF